MVATISLFSLPPSTMSTTSMVAASVTRSPASKRAEMPMRCMMASICGPPPCTTTGCMPTHCSSTMSRAKESRSASSVMAWPPYFTTTVLLAKS